MGMDVFGKNPTAEVGGYFRESVWGWRPLADYLTTEFPEETAGCTYWQSNDYDGLDADECGALASKLGQALEAGAVALYEKSYAEEQDNLPDHPCPYCQATGQRTWDDGVRTCNACRGTGRQEHPGRHYPFREETVRQFHQFLTHCGGFEIG